MSAPPLDYLLFKQGMDKGRGHKTRIIDKMLISTKRQNKKSSRPSLLRKHRVVSIKWRLWSWHQQRSSLYGPVPSRDQHLYSSGRKYGEMLRLEYSTGIKRHFPKRHYEVETTDPSRRSFLPWIHHGFVPASSSRHRSRKAKDTQQ